MKTRVVNVQKDQRVTVNAGRGVTLEILREKSGAVELRNLATGSLLRQWSPKEAKNP